MRSYPIAAVVVRRGRRLIFFFLFFPPVNAAEKNNTMTTVLRDNTTSQPGLYKCYGTTVSLYKCAWKWGIVVISFVNLCFRPHFVYPSVALSLSLTLAFRHLLCFIFYYFRRQHRFLPAYTRTRHSTRNFYSSTTRAQPYSTRHNGRSFEYLVLFFFFDFSHFQ